MKAIYIFLFSSIVLSGFAQSPFEKGRRIKTLGIDFKASGDGEYGNIDINHRYLKIIHPRIALGYVLNINSFSNYQDEGSYVEFGPTVRYAIPISEKNLFYNDLTIFFGADDYYDEAYKAISTSPGFAYFLTKNIAIEPNMIVRYQIRNKPSGFDTMYQTETYRDSKFVIGFQVGLQMYFDRLFDFSKKEFWKPNN